MGAQAPRVCVVGAGAVGGMIGAMLARSGVATSALARGETLAALQRHGWRLQRGAAEITGPVLASGDAGELGRQDVVVVAVKTHALAGLAPDLAPLIGAGTVLLPAMNGVPWWFCTGVGGPVEGLRLASVDPAGTIAAALPPAAVVGCVVHLSASSPAPGVSRHGAGQQLIVGEPTGGRTPRLSRVADLLRGAGFEVSLSRRIHADVWFKLWGNMTMNPISLLTGATMDRILDDELVEELIRAVMGEARQIGDRIGCPIAQHVGDRIELTRRLGAVKTSMLQDAQAGRPIELDALVGAVRELGQAVGVRTPFTDALLGLTRVAARTRGLYPDAGATRL